MPSVLPGYEYDIFISYRQKDNKGDGWVTEFVEALKTELEATFKEDISVYFDINPHDGLLETHDVAESLKEKLNALIFIPVVSRTYCDPNSYAWQHEFIPYIAQASQDRFGLKVKLPGGNVASRVLPVRIHDLEPEDIKLAESHLGFIRPVDFIYHSQGVNRPLRLRDDDLAKTGQQLVYRDQINKVANAIKEIINGLKLEPAVAEREKIQPGEPLADESFARKGEERKDRDRRKERVKKPPFGFRQKPLIWATAICILLIIAAFLVYPKIFKRDSIENLRSSGKISVAVMPFQNMTNDTIWNVWQVGIQDILITSLSNIGEIKVRQSESINRFLESKGTINYASITPSFAGTISQKLDANVLIYGNLKQAGSTIRLYAQLIDSKTEEVFKSFKIEGLNQEGSIFNLVDSLSTQVKNFLIISEMNMGEPYLKKHPVSTYSPEAYRYYLQGRQEFRKKDYLSAINLMSKAIAIDSNFIEPLRSISLAYGNLYSLETSYSSAFENPYLIEHAKKWCLKALEKSDRMPLPDQVDTKWIYARFFGTPYEEIKYLRQLIECDDQWVTAYFNLGSNYYRLQQYDKAIPVYEKALKIYEKWGLKPYWVDNYVNLGVAYHKTGQYKKEKKLFRKAEADFPDDPFLVGRQAILSISQGDTVSAMRFTEILVTNLKALSFSEAIIAVTLATGFDEVGIPDKAEEYYRQALSLEPNNPKMLNELAYFLINKDRGIHEGLKLVDQALELLPENYHCLETKGWGLFKQGKAHEALEFLEKSDSLRPLYNHRLFLHLEEVKKAVANQK